MKRYAISCILLLTLLLSSGCAQLKYKNWNQWTTYDKAAFTTAVVARGVDILQTRYAYDSPDFQENNAILSKVCNDKNCATIVLIGMEYAAGLAADHMSPGWRSLFLSAEAGKNVYFVVKNNQIGVGLAW